MCKKIVILVSFLSIAFITGNTYSQGWHVQSSGTGVTLRQVIFANSMTGWVVGQNGTILKSTNGGINWTTQSSGTSQDLYDICLNNENMLVVCGSGGTLLKTTNGGTSWVPKTSGTTLTLRSVFTVTVGANLYEYKAAGDNGVVVSSMDGDSWTMQNIGIKTLNDIMFFNSFTGWVVGNGGTFKDTYIGSQYANFPDTTDNLLATSHFYINMAVSSKGRFYRRMGSSWQTVNVTPNISLNSLAHTYIEYNRFWIAGNNGTVKYSNDTGNTWVTQTVNSTENIYSIFILDGQKGWIAGSGGMIAGTITGGSVGITQIYNTIPEIYSLSQNYPNPFNPSTKIKFSIPAAVGKGSDRSILLSVYNTLGKEVAVLVNEALQPGTYEYEFNAEGLTSGTYFYMLKGSSFTETKKMLLLK